MLPHLVLDLDAYMKLAEGPPPLPGEAAEGPEADATSSPQETR